MQKAHIYTKEIHWLKKFFRGILKEILESYIDFQSYRDFFFNRNQTRNLAEN